MLQRHDARQILLVSLVYLAGSSVGRRGLGTHQRVRTATALGDVREVVAVAVDDLMQMPAAVLSHGETVLPLVRVGQEHTQFATVAARARWFVRPPEIGRLFRSVGGAVFQLPAARAQPARDRAVGSGHLGKPGFENEDRSEMRVGQIVRVNASQRVIDETR